MNANVGYLFYKHYYKEFQEKDWKQIANAKKSGDIKLQPETIESISKINKTIQNHSFITGPEPANLGNTFFYLKTCNPGLLIGSGYCHETGVENEYKIGFFFDHTTGLPVVPGSSIKGVLRSVFPKPYDSPERKEQKKTYLLDALGGKTVDLTLLEKEIFQGIDGKGNRLPLAKRDIFFDACIVASKNKDNRIFDQDFITPHKDPLKNPIPIKFLKIMPNVVFKFCFDLKENSFVSKDQKKKLFKTVLTDIGAGAKTSVGYGQFESFTSANG